MALQEHVLMDPVVLGNVVAMGSAVLGTPAPLTTNVADRLHHLVEVNDKTAITAKFIEQCNANHCQFNLFRSFILDTIVSDHVLL